MNNNIEFNDKKKEKELRKIRNRKLNEPPHLTILEEVGNSVTHGIGAGLAIWGMVLMILKSDTALKVAAACVYGVSLTTMMLMSCLYHAFRCGSTVKRLWRRFDYSSIYLLIGGTFAPIYLVYWGNTLGMVLFIIQWSIIAFGITIVGVFGPGRFSWLHFALFFTVGWSGLMFIPDMYRNNVPLLWMIFLGGIVYTVGMIPFSRNKKGDHFIWHFFVLAGAIIHWLGIFLFVF